MVIWAATILDNPKKPNEGQPPQKNPPTEIGDAPPPSNSQHQLQLMYPPGT